MTPLRASTVFTVRVCQVFCMQLRILGAEDVLFLSHSDYIHSFFSDYTGELWHHVSIVNQTITLKGFWKTPCHFVLTHYCEGTSAGEQQLLGKFKIIICFLTWQVSFIMHWHIAASFKEELLQHEEKNIISLATEYITYDPNFPPAYDRCLAGLSKWEEVYFHF